LREKLWIKIEVSAVQPKTVEVAPDAEMTVAAMLVACCQP
jgi:hypothetical protein